MKRIAACAVLLALLPGCFLFEKPVSAPQYRTEYLYEGPDTDAGQLCVVRCEKVKAHCRTAASAGASDRYRLCDEQAQDEYESCAMRSTSFSERRLCYRKACPVSADYVSCETPYQACFETCGGRVWARQECESNCPGKP